MVSLMAVLGLSHGLVFGLGVLFGWVRWGRPKPEETFRGYTLYDAVERAVECGSIGAWEWLQAWWNADLDKDDGGPEDW